MVYNKVWFKKEYHIINYPNINIKARKANFYNYSGVICKYETEIFINEANKAIRILESFLKILENGHITGGDAYFWNDLLEKFKELIDHVRHSLGP